jgi:nitrite reductase/ring-hydroxylating ferredoxin subunit
VDDEPLWKRDFPIEWEKDNAISRRELAKFLTLGSAVLAAASAAVAWMGRRVSGRRDAGEARIASASALAPGSALLFRYPTDDDPCILVRERNGSLTAYSQVCTHLSCAVVHRPAKTEREEDALFCPCHQGWFACADGRPTAGPPTRRLPRIRIAVRGDDVIATGVEL